MRVLRTLLVRVALVFLLTSLCSFLALNGIIWRGLIHVVADYVDFVVQMKPLGQPMLQQILDAGWRSGILVLSATVLGLLIGVPLGWVAAVWRNNPIGRLASLVSGLGMLTPSFLFALFIMVFFVVYLARLTGRQWIQVVPSAGFPEPRVIIAPALALAARPIAHIAQVTAARLRAELEAGYVQVAHAKGLRRSRVALGHVWPNLAAAVLSATASSLVFTMSSLPIVEYLFAWNGIGISLFQAVLGGRLVPAASYLAVVAVTLVVVATLLELVAQRVDPRLALAENPPVEVPRAPWRWPGLGRLLLAVVAALVVARWRTDAALVLLAASVVYAGRGAIGESLRALRVPPGRLLASPSFLIGLAICLALAALVAFPASFAPYSPEFRSDAFYEIDGALVMGPFPPSRQFPLGTDLAQRDLATRIAYRAGPTLSIVLLAVALRLAIGGVLGVMAGWSRDGWSRFATVAALASGAIPSLLFAWMFIVGLGQGTDLRIFALGLGLTGWATWAHLIASEIRRVKAEPYVDAAESIGVPPGLQLSRYVAPQLLAVAIPAVAQEIAAAMLLLAELGFLGVFVGINGVVISRREGDLGRLMFETYDWAGMLAGTRLALFNNWWLPIAPAGAFLLTIVGVTLLADGLRDALDLRGRGARRGWWRRVWG